jgi:hypothetical protein
MQRFFQYISLTPMPLWLAMIVAPGQPLTETASRSSAVFGLAAVNYVLSLLLAGRQRGAPAEKPVLDLLSLDGVQSALSTKPGAQAAWAHMLALDVFTGAWIYRQAQALRAPSWVRITALALTLMTGPLGLLFFLIWRIAGAGQGAQLD